jgi:hypothetical protein
MSIANDMALRAARKLNEVLKNNNAQLSNYSTKHVYKDKNNPDIINKGLKNKDISVSEYACLTLREKFKK